MFVNSYHFASSLLHSEGPFSRIYTHTSVVHSQQQQQQPGTVVVPFQEQQQQQPGTVVVPFPPYIPLLSVITGSSVSVRPLPICSHARMQVIGEAICGCWRASSRRRQVRDHVRHVPRQGTV